MNQVFICMNCGRELLVRHIKHEEAEQRMKCFGFARKNDIHFVMSVCECTFDVKRDIVKKIELSVKEISDDLYN